MTKLAISLGLVVIMHFAALGQVDTLRLEQINSLSFSENTWRHCLANFQNDFSQELVVFGTTHIFVYEFPDTIPFWTSPDIGTPDISTVKFYDMNNDGDLDLCVQDNLSLWIFDVVHATTIWTSPSFAVGTNLFTIGDRNSDGQEDVVIVHRGYLNGDVSPDSALIYFYDGPDFQLSHTQLVLMTGYYDNLNYAQIKDVPSKIEFADISGSQGLERKLLIYSDSTYDAMYWDGAYIIRINHSSGNLRIIDPNTFAISIIYKIGKILDHSVRQTNNGMLVHAYTQEYETWSQEPGGSGGWVNEYLKVILPNEAIESVPIPRTYSSTIIGDIMPENAGDEICIVRRDSIDLYSYPELILLWSQPTPRWLIFDLQILRIPSLYLSPQIVSEIPPAIFNGADGMISAVFENTDRLRWDYIGDINYDGDDELFYSPDSRTLIINKVERISTAILPQPNPLPTSFRLYSNYPNPFNPTTTIQYSLPTQSMVSIDIFDILGRKIETLENNRQAAGHHQIIWDGKNNPSGIYFYKIQAGDFTETKKMLLLK